MALDRAPNSPQANQPLVKADRTPTLAANTQLEETWRQVVAGFVIVPCTAAGTNDIVLTPRLHQEGAATYGDGMAWSFTAAGTSSGAVTAAIGSLPAKTVYTNSGALVAGSGVIQSGSAYILMYVSALDAFVAFGSINLSGIYTPLTRTLTAAGLVTGGGNLSADRTFTVTAAVQADEEAGTSNAVAVTPGVQQFHPSAAKCWARVTVSGGTPTLQASYNITSITDTGVGDLTITIATDFSGADWVALATVNTNMVTVTAIAAGSVEIKAFNFVPAFADPGTYYFAGFGDQ
jgi:hypothetical protein